MAKKDDKAVPSGAGDGQRKSENQNKEKKFLPRFVQVSAIPSLSYWAEVASILFGLVAAILLVSTRALTLVSAAIAFGISTLVVLIILIFALYSEKHLRSFSWRPPCIVVLGFGLGTLAYRYRSFAVWLWDNYRRIHYPKDLLLESLFLLGIIMGFFVVRNWAKDQKEFVASLTGVLSGAFVATILGQLEKQDPLTFFSYYALGFTISGVTNLGLAALLAAEYTNKQSITSRAVLDFLYGPERAKTIDGYFLMNFEEDPDYAKEHLIEAVNRYKRIILEEFSMRMEERRKKRDPGDARREGQNASTHESPRRSNATRYYYYQMMSIDGASQEAAEPGVAGGRSPVSEHSGPPSNKAGSKKNKMTERKYNVTFRRLREIDETMFRAGVAIRWKDDLQYLVAPGQYRASFPYFGSTAGLSLKARVTIVMDRDQDKRFRTYEYREGKSPRELEQPRGLDEIDFLSYISIPLISNLSTPKEQELGVVNVDSKVFVTASKLEEDAVEPSDQDRILEETQVVDAALEVYSKPMTLHELTEYASDLYEQNDRDIMRLEKLSEILVPILQLYLKCRTGSS